MAAKRSADHPAAATSPAEGDWVELGRVLRPHGLEGALLVALHSDDPANLIAAKSLWLAGEPGTIPFRVARAEPAGVGSGGRARVRLWLVGLDSRERAARFASASVLLAAGDLAALPEGEFYWRELLGLTAFSAEGERLGTIAEIVPTAAADVLVIRRAGPDLLVPAVQGMVVRLDREGRELWLDLPRAGIEASP